MSKSESKSKKMPEWNIFDRLDELDYITVQLMDKPKAGEPTLTEIQTMLKDASILARFGVLLAFSHHSTQANIRKARKLQVSILKHLGNQGLSQESLKWLRGTMGHAVRLREESSAKLNK